MMHALSCSVSACGAAAVLMACAVVYAPAQTVMTEIDIAGNIIGVPPVGFDFRLTGEGELGKWTVVSDPTTATGFAIEHLSADQHEDRFPLAIYKPLSLENIELTVRFKIISGTMQTAGVAVGVRDSGNYYAVSASALEQRVDLYLFVNGTMKRLESADADIVRDRWYTLGLIANDDHFTVSLDRKVLFTTFDRSRMKSGRIALWTREDNITRFDQIEIRSLPRSAGSE